MACVVWGRAWKGQVVQVHSDNEAVVSVLNSGYSKDPQLLHLIPGQLGLHSLYPDPSVYPDISGSIAGDTIGLIHDLPCILISSSPNESYGLGEGSVYCVSLSSGQEGVACHSSHPSIPGNQTGRSFGPWARPPAQSLPPDPGYCSW